MTHRTGSQRIAVALLCLAASFAQAKSPENPETGTLDGKLTDTRSVPLSEAVVVVHNLSTRATARAVTSKSGAYHFNGLGPGEYSLEAELPALGNGPTGRGSVDGILISAGHATRVQAALLMELPSQSLPLEITVHQLDPVTPAVTTMIASEDLNDLPIPTRSWEQLAATTPATSPTGAGTEAATDSPDDAQFETPPPDSGTAALTTPSIDGVESASGFQIDASRHRETGSVGQSAVSAMQARSGNTGAEHTLGPAIAIELTTGRGHEGLHGQAFYMNRQSLWGAQNPFTQWIQQAAPATGIETAQFAGEPYTPADNRQTLGFSAGSRIRGNLFWFAALDGLLRNNPAVATVRHPDDFFAQPTLNDLRMLDARLGLPGPDLLENASSAYSDWLNQMSGLLGPMPRTSSRWQGFGRIDEQTERQHLTIEANLATADAPGGALSRTSEPYGSHSFGNSQASELWTQAHLESFLTPDLLNSAAFMVGRSLQRQTPQPPSSFEAPLLANPWGQLPEIIADTRDGFILGKRSTLSNSDAPLERAFVQQDTLSRVWGSHLIKAGGSFDHLFDSVGALTNQTGTYSYANVLNFISDAASFLQFGYNGVDNPAATYHNCDTTGRVYEMGAGAQSTLGGLGYLPCYAWYSQRIGPSNWHLSTNDLAAFATEQWQPRRNLTLSAGLRAEAEQLPAPISTVENPNLPATEKMPATGINLGPRLGLAWSPWKSTVLRLGGGLYYGRIDNTVALAALTQTGSLHGDLNFFFRPTDSGAPPFPYVFSTEPATVVTPGAVSFAPRFRAQEVDQAVFSLEQELPGHWLISAEALASLGRRLPISIDTNIDSSQTPQTITYAVVDSLQAGPIKSSQITVPFYTARLNTDYQQLASIESRANSTYDAALIKVVRHAGRGFNLRAHYLYAHATDWNPNESAHVAVDDVLDPEDFRLEYGTSNLDIRHSAAATVLYETPWKLRDWAGAFANGWSIAAVGQFRSGLPFTMRTGGYIPGFYDSLHALIEGIGPGINGSGGDNRLYGIGRNTYRYPATWTADTRLGKRFYLPNHRELELLAESFNLFNHQNVTLIETTGYTIERGSSAGDLPTLNFLTGLTSAGLPSQLPEFGKPLDVNATNSYHPREIQLGVRTRF